MVDERINTARLHVQGVLWLGRCGKRNSEVFRVMNIEVIEKMAARNLAYPDRLTPPELYLFLSLRALYQSYHVQALSKEQARTEKNNIISQYKDFELWHRIYVQHSRMRQSVQVYSNKITHSGCAVCKGLINALSGLKLDEGGDNL